MNEATRKMLIDATVRSLRGREGELKIVAMGEIGPPAIELAEACHHLMHVWAQYAGNGVAYNQRPIRLPHSFMRAGEDATDFLQRHGYATDAGDYAVLTPEGEALFDRAFDGPADRS